MENSLHSPHLYNTTYQPPNGEHEMDKLYGGLYGAQNSGPSCAFSKESQIPSSENDSPTHLNSYQGLHRPARLDWHQIGPPLTKNFANDVWLKTRRALAPSDSDEDTESLKEQRTTPQTTTSTNSRNPFDDNYTSPTPPGTPICVIQSSPGSIGSLTYYTPTLTPLPMPYRDVTNILQHRGMASQSPRQAQFTYIVLHDSVPVAAESLSITTVTGVYASLEEANGFVERIAEETCRDVPEEHLTLRVEDDGGYGFDILDMKKHMLHRIYIEKQVMRGPWSEKAEYEKTGVMRSQVDEDQDVFDEMAKLSL